MKRINCDICKKEIKYYNFESVIKMKLKVPYSDIENPKFHICDSCYTPLIAFMNGITDELKRGNS